MVEYTCSKCNKIFKQKGHYKAHLNKKFPCNKSHSKNKDKKGEINQKTNCTGIGEIAPKPVQDQNSKFECRFCFQNFTRKSSLNRHYNRCKLKKDNLLKEELFTLLLDNQKKQQEQQVQYQEQITELQNQISKLTKDNVKTINYNTYNTQNNNIINVLAYNKTDISHLKDKDYKKVLRRGNFCVPNLVDAIHFNPNKPENHNIYIPNMKTGYIMCWNGESWDIRNREDVIDDIYDEKSNLLIDKVDEWEDIGYKLDPIIMTKFKRFLSKMEDDIVKNKVKEEIRFLLYNKRNQIKNK
jgi:hypothetical protein